MDFPLLLVEWHDSQRLGDEWVDIESIGVDHNICISVGYLLKEDDKVIVIMPNLDCRDNPVHGIGGMIIPKCSVVKRRELK